MSIDFKNKFLDTILGKNISHLSTEIRFYSTTWIQNLEDSRLVPRLLVHREPHTQALKDTQALSAPRVWVSS